MSLKIIILIGVVILAVSSIGLGSNLNSQTLFSLIGSDDDVQISITELDITNVAHTITDSEITSSTITVKNTDGVSHSYKICVIASAGSSISDTPGTTSDCATTSTISSSSIDSAVIIFTNPLNVNGMNYSNISIQEIT